MKIKKIAISNFIGISEFNYDPSGITIIEGPKGSGKSSILEAIETAVSNIRRRTEVVRHDTGEASLFIETDTGLEIDRKVRPEKADYLKLRQEGSAIKSTEAELRRFISGDIFRPLDFINLSAKEQTAIILSMIKMDYTPSDICQWFGSDKVLSGINTDKHMLQILKDIESKMFAERTEVNREINILKAQVKGIEQSLPANYDGEVWRVKSLQEYYDKVSKAQQINNWIDEATALKANVQDRLDAIESDKQNQIGKITLKYRDLESEIKELIEFSKSKITAAQNVIENADRVRQIEHTKINEARRLEIEAINLKYDNMEKSIDSSIAEDVEAQNLIIQTQNQRIASKESELLSIDEKKALEIDGLDPTYTAKIETENARVGKAAAYLNDHERIDVLELQVFAEEVESMKEHLREWDRMLEIRNEKLAPKIAHSDLLSNFIDVARDKPSELLKQHTLPIDGIGVDENGLIRINGILLDGLSDGEKLESAFAIALQRIGELRVMCLDGLEKLNKSEQEKVIKICEDNNVQCFVTITANSDTGTFSVRDHL